MLQEFHGGAIYPLAGAGETGMNPELLPGKYDPPGTSGAVGDWFPRAADTGLPFIARAAPRAYRFE
jgi:hypothetical protein